MNFGGSWKVFHIHLGQYYFFMKSVYLTAAAYGLAE